MEYIRCQMENRLRRNGGREYALTQGGYYYARLYNLPKAWRPLVEGLLLAIVLHIGTWGHCSSNCITRSRLSWYHMQFLLLPSATHIYVRAFPYPDHIFICQRNCKIWWERYNRSDCVQQCRAFYSMVNRARARNYFFLSVFWGSESSGDERSLSTDSQGSHECRQQRAWWLWEWNWKTLWVARKWPHHHHCTDPLELFVHTLERLHTLTHWKCSLLTHWKYRTLLAGLLHRKCSHTERGELWPHPHCQCAQPSELPPRTQFCQIFMRLPWTLRATLT